MIRYGHLTQVRRRRPPPHIEDIEEMDFGTGMAFHKHYLSSKRFLRFSLKNWFDEKKV
jgi:hypothetical protein